jgi:hypothetical protein
MNHFTIYQKCAAGIALFFFIVIPILAIFQPPIILNSPFLFPIFNIIFIYLTTLTVGYLSAKCYLNGSTRTLLLLATGVLTTGSTALIGELLFLSTQGTFLISTIVNVGALLGSSVHFINLILTTITTNHYKDRGRKLKLLISYTSVVILTIIMAIISLQGETIQISLPGSVLYLLPSYAQTGVVVFCGITGLFFLRLYHKEGSTVLFWYSLGLLLIALAHVSSLLQSNSNDILTWTGRFATYTANMYLVIAVVVVFIRKKTNPN